MRLLSQIDPTISATYGDKNFQRISLLRAFLNSMKMYLWSSYALKQRDLSKMNSRAKLFVIQSGRCVTLFAK